MVATVQAICDYIYNDLATNVGGITDAKKHLYVPWSRDTRSAKQGARHISVHINTEEVPEFTTQARELLEHVEVLVWEDAVDTGARRTDDNAADLAFIQLWEAIRARFFSFTTWTLGNMALVESCRYMGTQFSTDASTRAMSLILEVRTIDAFTT